MEQNRFFPEIHGNFGFGCMRLPKGGTVVGDGEFKRMIDAFMSAGFNYFDTAHGYLMGQSEGALKRCLVKRYPRASFVLANKLSTHYFKTEAELMPLFEKQLKACGVETFDFYLMHAQDAAIFEKFRECRAYEFALHLKEQGKIHHFGISFHDKAHVLERILTAYPQIEVVQIQFNYVDYEDAAVDSRKVYEVCEKFEKPVVVMEPVKGGNLVNLPPEAEKVFDVLPRVNSNAGYALRFAASFPNISTVLSGMSSMAQMEDNLASMRDFQPFNQAEFEAVRQICEIFKSRNLIPCTACRYCIFDNECPKQILIPDLFAALNAKRTFHNWNTDYYYDNILTSGHGKASDCIQCGKCEKICPQHLEIRKFLREAAKEFGK